MGLFERLQKANPTPRAQMTNADKWDAIPLVTSADKWDKHEKCPVCHLRAQGSKALYPLSLYKCDNLSTRAQVTNGTKPDFAPLAPPAKEIRSGVPCWNKYPYLLFEPTDEQLAQLRMSRTRYWYLINKPDDGVRFTREEIMGHPTVRREQYLTWIIEKEKSNAIG